MKWLASVLLILVACGDDAPSDMEPDAGSDVDAGEELTDTVLAIGTDYMSTGIVTTIDVPSLETTQNAVDGVASTDPTVRLDGDIFVMNRFGTDNVTILAKDSLSLIDQLGTGGGSNPQDVAVIGDKLYVVGLNLDHLLVYDRNNYAALPDSIDLAGHLNDLDPDGQPNCHSLAVLGDNLYVSCELLDETFTARTEGAVLVFDTSFGAYVKRLRTVHKNPLGMLHLGPNDTLLLATVPNFLDPTEGCIEQITESTISCLATNASMGGFASGIVTTEDALYLAVVEGFDDMDFQPRGHMRIWNGTMSESLTPIDQRIFDVAVCPTGHVAMSDAAGGVRVYNEDLSEELTSGPIDIGLPSVSNGLVCF